MKRECLCCGIEELSNNKKTKLTEHHVIPKCMEPKSNFVIWLCDTCHRRLTSLYVRNPKLTTKQVPANFLEFRKNYENLRDQFHKKELDRGRFGEALWMNLINYLEITSEIK